MAFRIPCRCHLLCKISAHLNLAWCCIILHQPQTGLESIDDTAQSPEGSKRLERGCIRSHKLLHHQQTGDFFYQTSKVTSQNGKRKEKLMSSPCVGEWLLLHRCLRIFGYTDTGKRMGWKDTAKLRFQKESKQSGIVQLRAASSVLCLETLWSSGPWNESFFTAVVERWSTILAQLGKSPGAYAPEKNRFLLWKRTNSCSKFGEYSCEGSHF